MLRSKAYATTAQFNSSLLSQLLKTEQLSPPPNSVFIQERSPRLSTYKQLGPQGGQWLNPASDWSPCLLNVSILSFLLNVGRQKLKGTIRPKPDGSRGKHFGAKQTLATWLAPAGEFLDLQMGAGVGVPQCCTQCFCPVLGLDSISLKRWAG